MNDNTTKVNEQGSKNNLMSDKSFANFIVWCAAFLVVATATIIGNILTIAIFGGKHIQRKRTHFFLINLSTADLMVGSVAVPLWVTIIYQDFVRPRWQHKPIISTMYFTVDMLTGFASFFSVAAIALERLYSVIKPVKYRLLKSRRYVLAISCIWLSAGVVVLLKFVRFKIYKVYLNIIFLCLGLPLVVTVLSYFVIFMKMRKRLSNRQRSQRGRSNENDDIKLAWTLLLVTAVFFITWTPFVIINAMYIYLCLSGTCPNISQHLVYFTKLLQYGNSCVNPIIYVVRIPAFNKAAVNTLSLRCFGKRWGVHNPRSQVRREMPLNHLKRKCGTQDPSSTVLNRMSVMSSYIKSEENLNFDVNIGITRL